MDLYLHIGTEKTGTTTVQRFFRENRELLSRNGVLYPSSPGNQNHMGLAAAALKDRKIGDLRELFHIKSQDDLDRFRTTLESDLLGETQIGSYKTAVMSGEHCSTRLVTDEEVIWLRDFLKKFFDKIYIVVYIRRQDEYLLSSYSTSIKSGSTKPVTFPVAHVLERRYDYWELLSRWKRVFGRKQIICRRFEKPSLKSGGVVEDILEAMKLDTSLPFTMPERTNESLDAATLEFLRLFNNYVPRRESAGRETTPLKIVRLLAEISDGPLPGLVDDERGKFMAQFFESNRKVALEYFGSVREGSDDPLFAPTADERARTLGSPLTVERAVEIGAWLWQEKQAQVDRLSKRVQKAGRKHR